MYVFLARKRRAQVLILILLLVTDVRGNEINRYIISIGSDDEMNDTNIALVCKHVKQQSDKRHKHRVCKYLCKLW